MSDGPQPEAPHPAPPASVWRGRFFSDWLPRAALEAVLIVISLLAALWLNDWNDDRVRAHKVDEARQFIVEEVRANRQSLNADRVRAHHQRLLNALIAFSEMPNPTLQDRQKAFEGFRSGIHPASFRDTVWRSVSAGDLLQYMPPREVFALTDVYRRQDELNGVNQTMYAIMLKADVTTEDPRELRLLVQSLIIYLADVTAAETDIDALYARALEQMHAAPEPPERR